jgi:hypothetical protein
VRISRGMAAGAVIATLPLAGGQAQAAATTVRPMTSGWSVGQVNSLPGEDEIKAISVAPTGSTWSVGYQTVNGASVPLVQHLVNGTWTTAKSPGSGLGEISTLDASSSKDVWVFGTPDDGSYATRWNGTSWTRTTLSSGYYFATAAEALSPTNVWAVGGDRTKTAEHWTGSAWESVPLPVPARAIAGVSSTHMYAGGTNRHQPAVMHWTGSAWTLAKTPKLALPDPAANGVINDIYARSASDVWAAGGFEWGCGDSGDDVCTQPLLLHWDGAAWSTTSTSPPWRCRARPYGQAAWSSPKATRPATACTSAPADSHARSTADARARNGRTASDLVRTSIGGRRAASDHKKPSRAVIRARRRGVFYQCGSARGTSTAR